MADTVRVAILADALDYSGGSARVFITNLLESLIKNKPHGLEIIIIRGRKSLGPRTRGVIEIAIPRPGKAFRGGYLISAPYYLRKQVLMYFRDQKIINIIKRLGVDIFHMPNLGGAEAPPIAYLSLNNLIVTLHGVSPLVLPPSMHYRGLSIFKYLLVKYDVFKWKVFFRRKVRHIITVSYSAKRNISKYLGIPPERITVIYNGVDSRIFRPIEKERAQSYISKKYGIMCEFILHVSTYQPKKNVENIIRAFYFLKRKYNTDVKLVIVGRQPGHLRKMTQKLGLKKEVIFTGFVSTQDLPFFYNAALCFVFPSLHESSGLPLIEAMVTGCPVITSTAPACVETISDAGIVVDPENYQKLAEAMWILISNHSLREELSHKSLKRARIFSWDIVAKKYINLYFKLVDQL